MSSSGQWCTLILRFNVKYPESLAHKTPLKMSYLLLAIQEISSIFCHASLTSVAYSPTCFVVTQIGNGQASKTAARIDARPIFAWFRFSVNINSVLSLIDIGSVFRALLCWYQRVTFIFIFFVRRYNVWHAAFPFSLYGKCLPTPKSDFKGKNWLPDSISMYWKMWYLIVITNNTRETCM